jgi:hypothetical protein
MDRIKLLCFYLAVLTFFAIPLQSQVDTGTILGMITDPSGASVPNVKVTARNQDTGFSRTTDSSADGSYVLPLLPIGPRYTVTASAQGFKIFERTGMQLELKQNLRVDMQLRVGQVAEKIQVTGQAPLVDTHSVTGGEVVGEERLRELPLNGRNPLQLAELVVGVTALSVRPALDAGNRDANYMSVNGSRLNETDYQLNGVRFAGSYLNSGLNYPDPDALAEFKLITNPNSAEYGQYAGAVFSAVSKSGTNSFHGSAFEFLRNTSLNARNFFAPPGPKPSLKQNQFGATAGGRIIKDRVFWFGSYQGFRILQDTLSASTPLTPDERNGLLTSTTPIIDPMTGMPFSKNGAGQYVIPPNRINPVSQTLLSKYIPVGVPGQVYQAVGSTKTSVDQYDGRGDYRITDSNQVSGSLLWDTTFPENPFFMGSYNTYGSANLNQKVRVASGSYLHSFKPNIINEFRFGWSFQEEQTTGTGQISPADLGINNWNYAYITDAHPQSPTFAVTGRFTLGSGGFAKWREGGQNFQFTDILNVVNGKHNIRAGVDLYHREHHLDANVADTGYFIFAGISTDPTAEFLLGKPSIDLRVRYLNHPGYRAWSRGFFFQDDWKIHPRFTLNLGLRYELHDPFQEYRAQNECSGQWQQHGCLPLPGEATFRPGIQSTELPLAPLGLLYQGDKTPEFPNGLPHGMIARDTTQFQPRIGLVWDPFGDGKTSVRASAGLFTNAQYPDMDAQNSQDLPWVVVQLPVLPPGDLTDPYAGLTPFPPITNPDNLRTDPNFFQPYLPAYGYGWSPDFVLPRVGSFGLSVERQILPNLMLDVGYVGKLGRHLHSGRDINSAVFTPGGTNTYANEQERRPFLPSAYQSIWLEESIATSSFHSLQATLRYRMKYGLTFLSSYMWSHSIDTCSQYAAGGNCYNDPYNTKNDKGSSDQSQPQVYTLSLVYELPDPVKRMNSRTLSGILGNWEVSGIVSARTGLPFSVVAGYDSSITAAGNDRPDLVGNPNLPGNRSRGQQIQQWFNTSAFKINAPGTHGTVGRNTLYAPGAFNSDLGLFKNFRIRETMTMQFRAEFFNAFNQVHLGAPSAAYIATTTFGQISSAGDPRLIQFGLKLGW